MKEFINCEIELEILVPVEEEKAFLDSLKESRLELLPEDMIACSI